MEILLRQLLSVGQRIFRFVNQPVTDRKVYVVGQRSAARLSAATKVRFRPLDIIARTQK